MAFDSLAVPADIQGVESSCWADVLFFLDEGISLNTLGLLLHFLNKTEMCYRRE
jgi:hypothetical protein